MDYLPETSASTGHARRVGVASSPILLGWLASLSRPAGKPVPRAGRSRLGTSTATAGWRGIFNRLMNLREVTLEATRNRGLVDDPCSRAGISLGWGVVVFWGCVAEGWSARRVFVGGSPADGAQGGVDWGQCEVRMSLRLCRPARWLASAREPDLSHHSAARGSRHEALGSPHRRGSPPIRDYRRVIA